MSKLNCICQRLFSVIEKQISHCNASSSGVNEGTYCLQVMRDMNNVSYASYVSYARSYASYARSYVSYARSYASYVRSYARSYVSYARSYASYARSYARHE